MGSLFDGAPPEVVEVRRGEARARGVDLDAADSSSAAQMKELGSRLATTLDTSAIEHLITAGPAHSDRGDGGTLLYLFETPEGSLLFQDTSGRRWRAWVSFLSDARKGSGMRATDAYLDYSGRDDALSGGSRMIPVDTPAGTWRVWTKRVGNNSDLKLLLLHGGPDAPMSTSKPSTVTFQQRASSITTRPTRIGLQ